MQPWDRLDNPICAHGSPDALGQFLALGLHYLGLAFGLLDHHLHRNLFVFVFSAHLQDLQNQTRLLDNRSITSCEDPSIITTRQIAKC